jgi:hypothetical protein
VDVNDEGDVLVQTTFTDYLYHDGRFIDIQKAIVPDDGGTAVMNRQPADGGAASARSSATTTYSSP